MKELSEYVFDFASDMEEQLDANQDKGGWEGCTAKYLFREMFNSMDRARLAIENGASVEHVTKKLADAANYSMMLADNYDREHESNGDYKGVLCTKEHNYERSENDCDA